MCWKVNMCTLMNTSFKSFHINAGVHKCAHINTILHKTCVHINKYLEDNCSSEHITIVT